MPISTWQPGTLYLQGALVIPTTIAGAQATEIPNDDFEGGDTGWNKGAGWAINGNAPFSGSFSGEYTGTGAADIINSTKIAVEPGKAITAKCFVRRPASAVPNAAVLLQWYDAADSPISQSIGNSVTAGSAGTWRQSTVSAIAPPNAAKVSIGAAATSDGTAIHVDNFQWNYITGISFAGLIFKNVGETGVSGLTEPDWPTVVGGQVADPALEGDPEPPPPTAPPSSPPGQASSPNPSNGASGVDADANLFWSAGVDATSHDVYFGTVNPPGAGQAQGNQIGTSFDPGTMAFSTTYYWRIDEVNIQGTTSGSVWSFTTEADPGPPPPPPTGTEIDNPGFEEGSTGWTRGPGWTIKNNSSQAHSGSYAAEFYSYAYGPVSILQTQHRAVTPGTSITASCYIKVNDVGGVTGRAQLRWYDEDNIEISNTYGNVVSGNSYTRSTVGGVAPMGAAYVSVGAQGNSPTSQFGNIMWVDDFEWNL